MKYSSYDDDRERVESFDYDDEYTRHDDSFESGYRQKVRTTNVVTKKNKNLIKDK